MARNDVQHHAHLSTVRHLSPREVDTIRVALRLLRETNEASANLASARAAELVDAIVDDHEIEELIYDLSALPEVTAWRAKR